jgi:hypothetical protein
MEKLLVNQKKLEELIKECKNYNIFPLFLSHYVGALQHPISKLLKELITEVVETLSLMKNVEIEALINNFPQAIKSMVEIDSPIGNMDLQRVALYHIITEMQSKYFLFDNDVKQDITKSKVLEVCPELGSKFDKDRLLMIDDNFKLYDGGIEYKNNVLHYSRFFRRGYCSNPNFDFLSRFMGYYQESKLVNQFRIAIDHQRIMPKEFYERIFEMDTWFGPHFNKERIDDPNEVGLTVVKRNKYSLFELENHLDKTEFFWSYRNGVKTLQIEEVSGLNYTFDDYYLNRYVHSERDINKKVLRHFDGAVKVYLSNTYIERFNSNMIKADKSYKEIKLFRIKIFDYHFV